MTVAAAGLVTGSVGFFAARAGSLGAGRESTTAGVLWGPRGGAGGRGGARWPFHARGGRVHPPSTGPRRRGAAVLVGLSTLVALPSGRLGLPDDRFETLAFARAVAMGHGADRILLPGRVTPSPASTGGFPMAPPIGLSAGYLDYSQAWLPRPWMGDAALEGDPGRTALAGGVASWRTAGPIWGQMGGLDRADPSQRCNVSPVGPASAQRAHRRRIRGCLGERGRRLPGGYRVGCPLVMGSVPTTPVNHSGAPYGSARMPIGGGVLGRGRQRVGQPGVCPLGSSGLRRSGVIPSPGTGVGRFGRCAGWSWPWGAAPPVGRRGRRDACRRLCWPGSLS